MNTRGFNTLLVKEIRRFMLVTVQTVLTPVITSLLYIIVFAQVLEGRIEVYPGVSYLAFLVPGLVMMTVIQNAYANTTSSLMQSKMMGSIIFLLLAPLSSFEIYIAYLMAAILRGIIVGIGVYLIAILFIDMPFMHPVVVLVYIVLSGGILGGLGIIAGIWANQFEHMAAFQNFIILPLSFLSGVFYSIKQLPPLWMQLSHFNPFFYMVDGFRYGFLGISDVPLGLSIGVTLMTLIIVSAVALAMLQSGYKLRQ